MVPTSPNRPVPAEPPEDPSAGPRAWRTLAGPPEAEERADPRTDEEAEPAGPEAEGDGVNTRRVRARPTPPPDILYHATCAHRVEGALVRGVVEIRGGRPVYLSRHEGQAWQVAHRHAEVPQILVVDASRARRDGCRFDRNAQGLWQTPSLPIRHVLNLRRGYAEQVSAGGIPVYQGPDGPELALIRVQRRSGVTWEVAKGKLEPGESPAAAAVREVCEEMGCPMDLRVMASLGYVRYGFNTPEGAPRLKTLYMYLLSCAVRRMDFAPADGEGVLEVGWFPPDEAMRLVTHRSLRPLMRQVLHRLQG